MMMRLIPGPGGAGMGSDHGGKMEKIIDQLTTSNANWTTDQTALLGRIGGRGGGVLVELGMCFTKTCVGHSEGGYFV